MSPVRISHEEGMDAGRLWWVIVLVGLVSLAAGVILVAQPSNSLKVLAVVFGIFLVLDGIAAVLMALFGSGNRGLAAVLGVLGVVIGILLIRHPIQGVTAVGLLIGLWLVAAGVVRLLGAIAGGVRPLFWSLIAALEICAGIVIVAEPHIGYTTLAIITGIWLILNGLATTVLGFAIRRAEHMLRTASPAAG